MTLGRAIGRALQSSNDFTAPVLAQCVVGPATNGARCQSACQQDRTHGLGYDGAWRAVQGAEIAAGCGIEVSRQEATRIGEGMTT